MSTAFDNFTVANAVYCDTATVTTSGSVTNSSVLLVPANPLRKGFLLWNNSSNSAYIVFGPTASSATPTHIVATFTTLVHLSSVIWRGPISAIRNSGSGTITIYELI